jgi:hypothetical protein
LNRRAARDVDRTLVCLLSKPEAHINCTVKFIQFAQLANEKGSKNRGMLVHAALSPS